MRRRRRVTKAALEHFTMFLREMAFLERVTGNKSNAREWDDDSGDYVVLHSEHVVKEYKRKEALEAENARLGAQLEAAQQAVKELREFLGDGEEPYSIEDGFGSAWSSHCCCCGLRTMAVMRPGDARCGFCDSNMETGQKLKVALSAGPAEKK